MFRKPVVIIVICITILSVFLLITALPFFTTKQIILADFKEREQNQNSKIATNFFADNPPSAIVITKFDFFNPVYTFIFYYSDLSGYENGVYDARVYELERSDLVYFRVKSTKRYQILNKTHSDVVDLVRTTNLDNLNDENIIRLDVNVSNQEINFNYRDLSTYSVDNYVFTRMYSLPEPEAQIVSTKIDECMDTSDEPYGECLEKLKVWMDKEYPLDKYPVLLE